MHIKTQAICSGFICLDFTETDMNHILLLILNFAVGKNTATVRLWREVKWERGLFYFLIQNLDGTALPNSLLQMKRSFLMVQLFPVCIWDLLYAVILRRFFKSFCSDDTNITILQIRSEISFYFSETCHYYVDAKQDSQVNRSFATILNGSRSRVKIQGTCYTRGNTHIFVYLIQLKPEKIRLNLIHYVKRLCFQAYFYSLKPGK